MPVINRNPRHHIWLRDGSGEALEDRTEALCGITGFDEDHKLPLKSALKCEGLEEWITSAQVCPTCGERAVEELQLDVDTEDVGL